MSSLKENYNKEQPIHMYYEFTYITNKPLYWDNILEGIILKRIANICS